MRVDIVSKAGSQLSCWRIGVTRACPATWRTLGNVCPGSRPQAPLSHFRRILDLQRVSLNFLNYLCEVLHHLDDRPLERLLKIEDVELPVFGFGPAPLSIRGLSVNAPCL